MIGFKIFACILVIAYVANAQVLPIASSAINLDVNPCALDTIMLMRLYPNQTNEFHCKKLHDADFTCRPPHNGDVIINIIRKGMENNTLNGGYMTYHFRKNTPHDYTITFTNPTDHEVLIPYAITTEKTPHPIDDFALGVLSFTFTNVIFHFILFGLVLFAIVLPCLCCTCGHINNIKESLRIERNKIDDLNARFEKEKAAMANRNAALVRSITDLSKEIASMKEIKQENQQDLLTSQ
jgi:hypothetical protein